MTIENYGITSEIAAIFHPELTTLSNPGKTQPTKLPAQFSSNKTQPLPLPKTQFFLDDERYDYKLAVEIGQIERNYYALRHFLITPAVIQYEELVQLRQQAGNAENHSDWRGQLRLAVALLRLGRRVEATRLMQTIEGTMPLNSQETAVYRLWLALIYGGSGDYNRALTVARQLLLHLDEQQGRQLINFFNMVNRHATSATQKATVLDTVEAAISA